MPDFGSSTFSQTDANNNTGTMPSWLGTAAPSTLDDAGRALQGAVTREWNWRSYTVTAGGTANAKTLTYSVAPAAYYNGQHFSFIANTTNSGAVTLNVNGLGALAIRKNVAGTPTALSAFDMPSGMRVTVAYNLADNSFDWVNFYPFMNVSNTFTATQTFNNYVKFGNYGGANQGIGISNNFVSGSNFGTAFLESINELGISVGSVVCDFAVDGSSVMGVDVTPAGSRSSDRRRRTNFVYAGATSGNIAVVGLGGGGATEGRIDLVADADSATRSSFVSVRHRSSAISGDWYSVFYYNNVQIGSITQNGTTGILYNTTSDYRLKESVLPLHGALAKVAQLKPCSYTWKVDGSAGEGFIAHELQDVIPLAVTGKKDAVSDDGTPAYQAVDLSKVVPVLVAAIQELAAEVADLRARVNAA